MTTRNGINKVWVTESQVNECTYWFHKIIIQYEVDDTVSDQLIDKNTYRFKSFILQNRIRSIWIDMIEYDDDV